MDNFLNLTLSDQLSISKVKTPKLPLKSGTPLFPFHFGHFCRFFRGFSHPPRNALKVAQKFKYHQIPWTILHVFALLTMSLYRNLVAQKCRQSRALCTHLPTVAYPHYTVLTLDTVCAQKASFPRFLCFSIHHRPRQCHIGCLYPLPTQNRSLISP